MVFYSKNLQNNIKFYIEYNQNINKLILNSNRGKQFR